MYCQYYILHCINPKHVRNASLFACIDALRPSQQQWSCQDIASILWDFYQTLGCNDHTDIPVKDLPKSWKSLE